MASAHQTEWRRVGSIVSESRLKPTLSSRPHDWDGIAVDLYRVRRGDTTAPYSEHVVWLQLRGSTKCLWRRNGQVLQRTAHPGDITIAPVGDRNVWRHEDEKEGEIVALCLAPSFLQEIVKHARTSPREQIKLRPRFAARDVFIEDLKGRLLAELLSEGHASRIYVKSLATQLCIHLLRNYSNAIAGVERSSQTMPRYKLHLATDYINDNLCKDLTVLAIARQVSMARFRFARLFKQATGVAPHQYVTKLRIERAKSLLRQTELAVSEIGNDVGFSSPSHFSTVFRRYAGQTPRGYRRAGS